MREYEKEGWERGEVERRMKHICLRSRFYVLFLFCPSSLLPPPSPPPTRFLLHYNDSNNIIYQVLQTRLDAAQDEIETLKRQRGASQARIDDVGKEKVSAWVSESKCVCV